MKELRNGLQPYKKHISALQNELSEVVDEGDDDDLGDEAFYFVGNRVVPKLMEGGEFLDGSKVPVEEKIGKLEKVGEKGKEPAEPGVDREGFTKLEKEKDKQDTGGEVS